MKVPLKPPDINPIIRELSGERVADLISRHGDVLAHGKYLHWDALRHRQPPDGLTSEEWWAAVKLSRMPLRKNLPLHAKNGLPFYFMMVDPVVEMVQKIDSRASGQIRISEEVTNREMRDSYIVDSLIEEAITSSQLEGASTTGSVARNMLRTRRKPIDRDELMVLNNYHAMGEVKNLKGKKLSPEEMLRLQEVLTQNTLDDPGAAGRLRNDDDEIVVRDPRDQRILHVPPPAAELPDRINALCDFANKRTPDYFVHPVIRSIVLHFAVGYDHPFVDGNGRTARALFYWSMLDQEYWLAEFLSISGILKKAPAQYARSFLESETDDGDVTYFIIYQLEVILRAIKRLEKYLARKMTELRETEALLRRSDELNHRQLGLVSHALRHPGARYSIRSHQDGYRVSYMTARSDLLSLAERDLLLRKKSGNKIVFIAPENLVKLLKEGD